MLVTDQSACAAAPGKAILFGEHAVVFGQPAIAASLSDLRIWVLLTPTDTKQLRVSMPDLLKPIDYRVDVGQIQKLDLQAPPTPACADHCAAVLGDACDAFAVSALTPVLYLVRHMCPPEILKQGLDMWVRSQDLPVGAGLGSSAAFGVACAAALLRLQHPTQSLGVPNHDLRKEIDRYSFYSEILLHGTPSGIDNAVSCHGGAIVFQKGTETSMKAIENMPELSLLLVNTRVPRSTKELVAGVRNLYHTHRPTVSPILDAIGAISSEFQSMIQVGSLASLGSSLLELVRLNQALLQAIGVSHPSLERVATLVHQVAGDRAAAKLTGAGGGGCAIVLFKPDEEAATRSAIEAALRRESEWNYQCFSSKVGGDGVTWMDPKDFPKTKTSDTTRIRWALAAGAAMTALVLLRSHKRL